MLFKIIIIVIMSIIINSLIILLLPINSMMIIFINYISLQLTSCIASLWASVFDFSHTPMEIYHPGSATSKLFHNTKLSPISPEPPSCLKHKPLAAPLRSTSRMMKCKFISLLTRDLIHYVFIRCRPATKCCLRIHTICV